MDAESKLAVVKRACFVVITTKWLYWRPSPAVGGQEQVEVKRIKLGSPETENSTTLVADDAREAVEAWKDGRQEFPEDYEEQIAWEEEWMNAVMSNGALPIPRAQPELPAAAIIPEALVADPTPATQVETVHADAQGRYNIPIARVSSHTSSKRRRFNFSLSRGESSSVSVNQPFAIESLDHPQCPSSSSSGSRARSTCSQPVPQLSDVGPVSRESTPTVPLTQEHGSAARTAPIKQEYKRVKAESSDVVGNTAKRKQDYKRVKAESTDVVAKQEAKVARLHQELADLERARVLRAQIEREEQELLNMSAGGVVKSESEDNAFNELVEKFVADTRECSLTIDESPVKIKPEPSSQQCAIFDLECD